MAIAPNTIPSARKGIRDHGNPGLLIPNPQTTSITPPPASEIQTSVVVPISTPAPISTTPRVTTTTLSTSTSSQFISMTTASTSISTSLTNQIFSTISTLPSTPTASTSPTVTVIAPPDTSSSSSSQPTTLITLCILSLILGLIGLIILVLAFLRRQARRQRARSMKREVELLKVETGTVLTVDANAADHAGQSSQFVGAGEGGTGGKWEAEELRVDDKEDWEKELESGQVLPPYSR